MNLRKFLGLRTSQEKVEKFKSLKNRLDQLNVEGRMLADRYMLQKSIMNGVEDLPEVKRSEVFKRYNDFTKEHYNDVTKAVNERNKVIKSLEMLRNDSEIGEVCRHIDLVDTTTDAYKAGRIEKSTFFEILQELTGQPTKYADVVVRQVEDPGMILILHRVADWCPTGEVCVPGGHVEPGEDFKAAALRELKEETNLDPIAEKGIEELGSYTNETADIRYYQVWVSKNQPITVDSSEHCFFEWIPTYDIPLKPFIFEQGEIIADFFMPACQNRIEPIRKAYESGRMSEEVFEEVCRGILSKMITTDDEAALIPESMDGANGSKKQAIFVVKDSDGSIGQVFKAVSGVDTIFINNEKVDCCPFCVNGVQYVGTEDEPIRQMQVEFIGEVDDIKKFAHVLKLALMRGTVEVKTPHEEFMMANEHGTDYVGDPIVVGI